MPRSLSNSHKGIADESRRPSNKTLKSKKSASGTSRKFNLSVKSQDRLVGGADVPETEDAAPAQEVHEEETVAPAPVVQATEESPLKSENGKFEPSAGPCCFCVSQPGTTGDKKVDEMIDYVHQNLQEAGKALATLSENFEHELKLMFADILGRIQQWTGLVQNKLDICKNEIEALRKELMARACEIAELRKKLTECEEHEHQLSQTLEGYDGHSKVKETVDEGVHTREDGENDVRPSQTMESNGKAVEIVCTDAAIQSMMKDKERMRREIELEAEIMRLRKENERIMKERREYENAIQRALLRGVSSLNVEALRVLRCPPIPCCTPCAPCPNSEPIPVCRREPTTKGCVTQRSGNGKNGPRDLGSCTVKRPCASPCCSAGKSRKSASNNSMIFLLHQGDAGTVCGSNVTPMSKVCGQPVMKKIEIPPCPRFR